MIGFSRQAIEPSRRSLDIRSINSDTKTQIGTAEMVPIGEHVCGCVEVPTKLIRTGIVEKLAHEPGHFQTELMPTVPVNCSISLRIAPKDRDAGNCSNERTDVHVVWQDNYSNAVMYREGTYVEPVLLEEATTQNVIKVFPNPAESAFNINSEIGLETIRLYDAQQGIVKNLDLNGNKIVNIPINKLTPGLFLIVIKDVNGAVHTEKIIIQ